MSGIKFLDGVKTPFGNLLYEVATAGGKYPYLPWASALALAGRPAISPVEFDGLPYLPLFGGAVVAVEGESGQRCWLPVLNASNKPVEIDRLSSRDVNDSLNRAKAKAIALDHGVGLALYGRHPDAIPFLRSLRIRPDSDLAAIEPLVETKPGRAAAPYVSWAAAYAAAKITDPEGFRFDVLMFEHVNEDGEIVSLPARQTHGGWMVAIKLQYKGQEATEWLPIMGVQEVQTKNGLKKMDHQPLVNPSVFDWNKAVMRCLTRGIATLTGYGLSVYAGEDVMSLHRSSSQAQAPAQAQQQAPEAPEAEEHAPDQQQYADEGPCEQFDYEEIPQQSAVPEPAEALVEKLLIRIGNISSPEALQRAMSDLTKAYGQTQAFSRISAALAGKEAALSRAAA